MAVDRIVIHHEGGGKPGNVPASPLYSVWIGATTFVMQHSPVQDGSTAGLNGKVLGVCFSGQRHRPHWWSRAYPISENDLRLLAAAMEQARVRGWVADSPRVDFHGDPSLRPLGNATVCPGNLTYARRAEIEVACQVPGSDWTKVIERLGVLQPGDKNDRVRYLQGLLNVIFPDAGFKMSGKFGPKTIKYVKKVRQLAGLNTSNEGVGPEVWKAMIFFAGLKAERQ